MVLAEESDGDDTRFKIPEKNGAEQTGTSAIPDQVCGSGSRTGPGYKSGYALAYFFSRREPESGTASETVRRSAAQRKLVFGF